VNYRCQGHTPSDSSYWCEPDLYCPGGTNAENKVVECNMNACITYSWKVEMWEPCPRYCGGATHTRDVVCEKSDGSIAADSECAGVKPILSEACAVNECEDTAVEVLTPIWGEVLSVGELFTVSVAGGPEHNSLEIRIGTIESMNADVFQTSVTGEMLEIPGAIAWLSHQGNNLVNRNSAVRLLHSQKHKPIEQWQQYWLLRTLHHPWQCANNSNYHTPRRKHLRMGFANRTMDRSGRKCRPYASRGGSPCAYQRDAEYPLGR
jgi:hypothetical protein